MDTVYTLSAKGQRERAAARPMLADELHSLLRMVDGQRTRSDLLAHVGKSAITTGGLRWLTASGYLLVKPATATAPTFDAAARRAPPASDPAPPVRTHGLTQPHTGLGDSARAGLSTRPALSRPATMPALAPNPGNTRDVLADFMLRSIGRHLGTSGVAYQREVERATSVDQLLPLLAPLMEAILAQASHQAAAEFGDTAAFILQSLKTGHP